MAHMTNLCLALFWLILSINVHGQEKPLFATYGASDDGLSYGSFDFRWRNFTKREATIMTRSDGMQVYDLGGHYVNVFDPKTFAYAMMTGGDKEYQLQLSGENFSTSGVWSIKFTHPRIPEQTCGGGVALQVDLKVAGTGRMAVLVGGRNRDVDFITIHGESSPSVCGWASRIYQQMTFSRELGVLLSAAFIGTFNGQVRSSYFIRLEELRTTQ